MDTGLYSINNIVTNKTENFIFGSPKFGQAVSQEAGMSYASKLLHLPKFLNSTYEIDKVRKGQAFNLTSYFLERYIFQRSGIPQPQRQFIEHILGL